MNFVFNTSPDVLILCALQKVHGLSQASNLICVKVLHSVDEVVFVVSYQLIDFFNGIVDVNTKLARFIRSKREEKF